MSSFGRQFWELDSDRILQLFIGEIILAAVLKLHILQEFAEECRVFLAEGRRKRFAPVRKRSIPRPPAKYGSGEAAEQGPILSDYTPPGELERYESEARWRGAACVEALSKNVPWPRWFNLPQRMSQGSVTASEGRIQNVQG